MKVHSFVAISVLITAAWTGLSGIEWAVLIMTIGVVLSLELMNTAIEAAIDLVTQEFAELAKVAKDAASGAVLMASIAAVGVAGCLFLPHWIR